MNADKDTLNWLKRLGITEATGDDKFDSMMSNMVSQGKDPKSNIDTLDQDKMAGRVDNFINKAHKDKYEPYTKSSGNDLVAAGDKIIDFITRYCDKRLGPSPEGEANDSIPAEFFYCERMLKTSQEFEEMIEELGINPQIIPADVEKYASTDIVDWICKRAKVSRKDFEQVEDLAYEKSDGASTNVMRMFPYNWFFDMVEENLVVPWENAVFDGLISPDI